MDATPLASLSLTHVHYNPTDPLSHLCAWLALIPQTLCIIYITLILSTREVEILLMFLGQMACEALNFALKRLIKAERPRQMNGKGYGMPSSHAQFMAYFAVALSLFLLVRHRPGAERRRRCGDGAWTFAQRGLVSLGTVVLAGAVAGSRVYLNYHTRGQVGVGCGAGVVSGVGWFLGTEVLRREGWVEWGVESWVGRVGRWRDLVVEEDLAEAGWRAWEGRRAVRGEGREGRGEGNGGVGKKVR